MRRSEVYLEIIGSKGSSIKFLRQHVVLTGLNSPQFDLALDGIQAIHSIFSKDVRLSKLHPWMPGTFAGYKTIEADNRYFTSAKFANRSNVVPFDPLVDPDGVLASVDQSRYLHVASNNVGYFTRQITPENKTK